MADEWVLVPKVPTEAMEKASRIVTDLAPNTARITTWGVNTWAAMIAAAPPPPVREEMESDMREAVARLIEPNAWMWFDRDMYEASYGEDRRTSLAKADLIIAQIVDRLQPAPWKPEREAVAKTLAPHLFPQLGETAAEYVGAHPSDYATGTRLGDAVDAILALPSALVVEGGAQQPGVNSMDGDLSVYRDAPK